MKSSSTTKSEMDEGEMPEVHRGTLASRSSTTRALLGTATPMLKDLHGVLEDDIMGYTASRPKGPTPLPSDILTRPLKVKGSGMPFFYGKKALRSVREDSGYFDVWPANAHGCTPTTISDPHDMGAKPQLLISVEQSIHKQLAALKTSSHTADTLEGRESRLAVFQGALKQLATGFRTYRGVLEVCLNEFDEFTAFLKSLVQKRDKESTELKFQVEQAAHEVEVERRRCAAEVERMEKIVSAAEGQLVEVRGSFGQHTGTIVDLQRQLQKVTVEKSEGEEIQTQLMKRIQRLEKDVFLAKKACEAPTAEIERMTLVLNAKDEKMAQLVQIQEQTVHENYRLICEVEQLRLDLLSSKTSSKLANVSAQLVGVRRKLKAAEIALEQRTPRPAWGTMPIELPGTAKSTREKVEVLCSMYVVSKAGFSQFASPKPE